VNLSTEMTPCRDHTIFACDDEDDCPGLGTIEHCVSVLSS
jgi:hypothetical protein